MKVEVFSAQKAFDLAKKVYETQVSVEQQEYLSYCLQKIKETAESGIYFVAFEMKEDINGYPQIYKYIDRVITELQSSHYNYKIGLYRENALNSQTGKITGFLVDFDLSKVK